MNQPDVRAPNASDAGGSGSSGGSGGSGGSDHAGGAARAELPVPLRVFNGVCVGLASFVLVLIECFLVPLEAGTVPIPVAFVLAAAGNIFLPYLMKAVTDFVWAAAVPGVVWFVVVLTAASRTSEGDLVLLGTVYHVAFLLVGAVAAAIGARAIRSGLRPPTRRPTPAKRSVGSVGSGGSGSPKSHGATR